MRKKLILYLLAGLIISLPFYLQSLIYGQSQKPEQQSKVPLVEMELKVFEGTREGQVEPIKTVTSSFWKYTLSASIKTGETSGKEETQLRRVFNLKSVQLLTESNLSWDEPGSKQFHIFRLDSQQYATMVTLLKIQSTEKITCRIEFYAQEKENKTNLLDSELNLDKNALTAFGFEDKSGRPYFLLLKVSEIKLKSGEIGARPAEPVSLVSPIPPIEPPLPPDVVRATGNIMPPRLIKKVNPIYPEEARKAGVEGMVILEVQTDKTGKIAAVKVLRSVPLLDEAAIEAVRQWVYEPLIINGEPKGVIFTVTVSFKLKRQ
ncbi:MAG: energy transducer TonB [Candidatus Saccharicenans sp.]